MHEMLLMPNRKYKRAWGNFVKNLKFWWHVLVFLEIEMVIMERCKLSELSISAVTEQNTTDEEKSAAASGSEITNWNRYKGSIKDFVELLPHLPSP